MDAKTREALEASIKHWEENVAAKKPEDASTGPDNCALCKLFYDSNCNGCPVAQRTGFSFCSGSPYEDAEDALVDWEVFRGNHRSYWRKTAQAELDFLKSLRPEGESNEKHG